MSIFVPKSSTATRYKEVFGAKMRTYENQVAGSISTQGGRIGVTADTLAFRARAGAAPLKPAGWWGWSGCQRSFRARAGAAPLKL